MKETHHFYPVLFYFRLPMTFYSMSSITAVSLDAASLILSALEHPERKMHGPPPITELAREPLPQGPQERGPGPLQ